MREISEDERPRERLLKHGAEVLGDPELVAIVLGAGLPGENVVELARRLMDSLGGLAGLARADAVQLQRVRGIGSAKAAQLAAAMELGRRMNQLDIDARPMVSSPEAAYAFLSGRMTNLAREQLFVLALDTRGRLLGSPSVIHGTVGSVNVRAVEVFREAIVLNAVSVIFAHNHPSGDPRPSPQDVAVTRDLVAAGALLEIEVIDHIIIGAGRFISMRRDGYGFGKAKAK